MKFFRKFMFSVGGVSLVGFGCFSSYLYYKHKQNSIPYNTHYTPSNIPMRSEMINKLKQHEFDIIVIGGGSTGSGVALDAATRGLTCALVEENDFGSGTSGKSTKLLHGGVRYLEAAFKKLDINQLFLVWEALEERAHMMKMAPFMSQPVPIVIPIYKTLEVPYYWIGVKFYDFIANLVCGFKTGLPTCYFNNKSSTLYHFDLLKSNNLKGSIIYYDGQHNDTRMNLHIALTSCMENYVEGQKGATVANHLKLVELIKSKHQKGEDGEPSLIGVKVEDKLTGEKFNIYGKAILNCTGPCADEIRKMADPDCTPILFPSSGVHLTFPRFYASNFGLLIPETEDDRLIYYLPWEQNVIVGTTDQPCEATKTPTATQTEIDFLIKESCKYLNLSEEEMKANTKSVWSGLRPLVKMTNNSNGTTSQMFRSHTIIKDKGGLISLVGGKWTTYRRMAQEGLDEALKMNKSKFPKVYKCRTKNLLVKGSTSPSQNQNQFESKTKLIKRLCQQFPSLNYTQAEHLVSNYGYNAFDVCTIGESNNLLTPLAHNQPIVKAEIIYAIRNEMAIYPSDVLGRRTRLAFIDTAKCRECLDEVLSLMGKELKWTSQEFDYFKNEAQQYLKTMEAPVEN